MFQRPTVVMLNASDFDELPRKITDQLLQRQPGAKFGVTFISRETGNEITDPDELFGALNDAIRRAIGTRQ